MDYYDLHWHANLSWFNQKILKLYHQTRFSWHSESKKLLSKFAQVPQSRREYSVRSANKKIKRRANWSRHIRAESSARFRAQTHTMYVPMYYIWYSTEYGGGVVHTRATYRDGTGSSCREISARGNGVWRREYKKGCAEFWGDEIITRVLRALRQLVAFPEPIKETDLFFSNNRARGTNRVEHIAKSTPRHIYVHTHQAAAHTLEHTYAYANSITGPDCDAYGDIGWKRAPKFVEQVNIWTYYSFWSTLFLSLDTLLLFGVSF
jgi:hypothetical protein